jgi:hypothetical protein
VLLSGLVIVMEPCFASGIALGMGEEIYFFGNFEAGGATPIGVHSNELYRFKDTWSVVSTNGNPPSPRSGHCGFILDDSLFLFGGQNEQEGKVFDSSHCINLISKEWSPFPSLPQSRHSSSCVLSGRIGYLHGGANEEGVLNSLLFIDPGND